MGNTRALTDLPVPALEMAQTTLLALVFLIAISWLFDAMSIVNEFWSFLLIPLVLLAVIAFDWIELFSFVAGHSDSLTRILFLIAVSAATLCSAVIVAHKRDF
jgi:hypothetical protein